VSPILVALENGIGKILIEEVVRPFPLDQSVGIVQPVGGSGEVITWAKSIIHGIGGTPGEIQPVSAAIIA
jgi:hypothetical protein